MWTPRSRPQWLALLSQADELFYGGQAGGGKSDLILGLGLIAHNRSIIFRRERTQLTGATGLVERSREIISSHGRYNGMEMVWRNLPGDRMLEFSGVQYEKDVVKHKGKPHDLKAFDELTEFTEYQYRFLIGWLRSINVNQRCRVVATGNPPTHRDGEWVIRYWAPWLDKTHPNPAIPGELRWFAMLDGESVEVDNSEPFEHKSEKTDKIEKIVPKSRTFIPATLEDNVFLNDGQYEQTLQGLPEPLRSQLLYGDFGIRISDNPWQLIPTYWVELAQERWKQRDKPEKLSALGVDAIRGGADKATIAPRYDNYFDKLVKFDGGEIQDGPDLAAKVVKELGKRTKDEEEAKNVPIQFDIIGIGSSGYDFLIDWGANAIAVNAAAGSTMRDKTGLFKMTNVRAEMWWGMMEALDPKTGDDIALPPDSELLADLVAPTYKVVTGGIVIEKKKDIRKRLKRSTDAGDAVIQARRPEPILFG